MSAIHSLRAICHEMSGCHLYFKLLKISLLRAFIPATCLGVKLDNRRSWSDPVSYIRKCFSQKIGALKRMNYLPVKTLQEIYLKTIIRNVTYCTSIWGNCATDILWNLDFVHSRAVIIIFNLYLSLSDAKCLSKCNWPSISYFYKKSVLIFKHKVYFDSLFETKLFVCFVPTLIAYLVAQTSCLKRLPKCNLSIFSCPPPPIKAILFHSPL